MRLLIIFCFLLMIVGCLKPTCTSTEELCNKAKPTSFSANEKLRIPYRNINKITFLLNDSQSLEYYNAKHNDFFDCSFGGYGDCLKCNGKYEREGHSYSTNNPDTLFIVNYKESEYPYGSSLGFQFGRFNGWLNGEKFDSIPYLDSVQILGKTYRDVFLVILNEYDRSKGLYYYDSLFYTKDFGIIQIRCSNANKYDLLKVE